MRCQRANGAEWEQVRADDCVIIENNKLRLATDPFIMFYVNKLAEAERIKRSAVEFADAVLAQAEEHYDKNLSLIQQARRVVRNQG